MKRRMATGKAPDTKVKRTMASPSMHGTTAKRPEPDVRPTAKKATAKTHKLDGKLL